MKIVLLDDLPTLGRRGDVREVADGYARNYLLPRKLAVVATDPNLKNLTQIRKHHESVAKKAKEEAERTAQIINSLTLTFARQASEEDRLFGSVNAGDLVDALTAHGVRIEKRRVDLHEPIKALGEHRVPVDLYQGVAAQLKVVVVRE
ncbi:MAG TPA: 50S ribosomal protein L9 [Methylomirabilota bacterium]|nr:50S ribosomal protein L9 [Methylomirabilota bacterium]